MYQEDQAVLSLGPADLSTFAHDLPAPLTLDGADDVRREITLLETFDGRLYRAGLGLWYDGTALTVVDTHLQPLGAAEPCAAPPRFAQDLPAGARAHLASVMEMRALLPLAPFTLAERPLTVVDDLHKIRVRLTLIETFIGEEAGPVRLVVRALRGYEADFRRVCAAAAAGRAEDGEAPLLHALLSRTGRKPDAYSGKLRLRLKPTQTAGEAARVIYRRLLRIMDQNVGGVCDDTDTEFLHDFRVAVRRTRSGLSQIKGVYGEAVTATAKADFATLGRWTNTLRDLDVYLLAQDRYMALVPEEMHAGLGLFFAHLQGRRDAALQTLRAHLTGPAYADICSRWSVVLGEAADGPAADMPVKELAGACIYKKYKKIRRMGRVIGPGTPDQNLHDLRIECKKLRYLLEFFSTLYPADLSNDLVRRLKRLQTVLGDFNDLYVQGRFLAQTVEEITTPSRRLRPTVAALGMLMGRLHGTQRALKDTCIERVGTFLAEETHRCFRAFKPGEEDNR